MTLKAILGWVVLLCMGFILFVASMSFGFAAAAIVSTLAWWQIIGGTVVGTIAVVLHYIVKWEMEDKKKDEQAKIQ